MITLPSYKVKVFDNVILQCRMETRLICPCTCLQRCLLFWSCAILLTCGSTMVFIAAELISMCNLSFHCLAQLSKPDFSPLSTVRLRKTAPSCESDVRRRKLLVEIYDPQILHSLLYYNHNAYVDIVCVHRLTCIVSHSTHFLCSSYLTRLLQSSLCLVKQLTQYQQLMADISVGSVIVLIFHNVTSSVLDSAEALFRNQCEFLTESFVPLHRTGIHVSSTLQFMAFYCHQLLINCLSSPGLLEAK